MSVSARTKRASLCLAKKSNAARTVASTYLWPERRPKRSSDALRRRDVRFLRIDPAHARFRSLFLHRVNDKHVPASVSRSHRVRLSSSRARVARARPFVRPRARAETATARSSRSHLDDDERSPELIERQRHGSVARAAGLIVRRRRRRSIGRSIGRSIDRPLGLVDWFVYIVYICRLQPSTSATGVVYDPSDQRTGHDLY